MVAISEEADFGEQNITCTLYESFIVCNGTTYEVKEGRLTYKDQWFWIYIGIYVVLVLFAGLMSGLTMGLLSLDMMSLQVLKQGGTPSQQKYAKRILPLIKRHHLLLVTLLLANAVAVESMPLFLDRVSDPITAILVSVTAVLFFGEVFPQALCTRFGLAIGATLSPLVYLFMGLFFIIAWPIAKLLDCLLGTEHGTFFRRAELKALVSLHGPPQVRADGANDHTDGIGNEEQLTLDEVLIIKGALEMKDKTVKNAMMPLESVFMLPVESVLDETTMEQIMNASHSRVPIYDSDRDNILGVILVKRLIKMDPEDAIPVKTLLDNDLYFREVPYITEDKPLYDTLNDFQTGKCHLSVVIKLPDGDSPASAGNFKEGAVVGIITLEDVIEELIQEEIIDETDVYVDVSNRISVARAKAKRQISARDGSLSSHSGVVRQHSCPSVSSTSLQPPDFISGAHSVDLTYHEGSDTESRPLL